MLRVQKKRRPEDWDRKKSSLSGRFLPMDPRDEAILDLLAGEPGRRQTEEEETYGPEGPPSEAYGGSEPGSAKKWSKRSEAARKRWADPAYRAKVLQKRAEKRRRDAEAAGEPPKQHKVEIGRMDSITLCDEERAKAINAYARSNQLRSEKITAFHKNKRAWMENRLKDSPMRLSDDEYIERKKAIRDRRRQSALKREREKRESVEVS